MASRGYDVIIIGGGLAGLLASWRLLEGGAKTLVMDAGLESGARRLGGFAEFSGAKFSFLPAGQGLIPLAGSREALTRCTDQVIELLGLAQYPETMNQDAEVELQSGLALRSYESIVLDPVQMRDLLERLVGRLSGVHIVDARATRVQQEGSGWSVVAEDGSTWKAKAVLFAGGRTGGDLLSQAGAEPQPGKGVDVGVRIEFLDKGALDPLRSMGPDAKVLSGATRTFCLNHPGHIFRYPFENYTIPGGVVAAPSVSTANVGILHRLSDKAGVLAATRLAVSAPENARFDDAASTVVKGLGDKLQMTRSAWGVSVADALQHFCDKLGVEGLVDWSMAHRVHWPLLDWHWKVFGRPATAETTKPGLFVAGDSAGHARGLLQAAVSGFLAAGEIAGAS